MNLENVRNYPQALIAIRPSRILKGECGVFALRALKKGTTITRAEDFNESIFISWKEFTKLDRITQKRLKMFCAQYPDGICAPKNINNLTIIWHINHSCNPNVYMNKKGDYAALAAIKRGEELTIDFLDFEKSLAFKMNCKCGSTNCRKIIQGKP